MGTRCLTVFADENEKEIAVLYRQFDGYPGGHGVELAEILCPKGRDRGISNGISGDKFNGAGCLAAEVVGRFKVLKVLGRSELAGGFYLEPAGTRDVGEEFVYTVRPRGADVIVECSDSEGKILFAGPAPAFRKWAREQK